MRFFIIVILSLQLFGAEYLIDFQGNKTFSKERLYQELGFKKSLWQRLFGKFEPKADEKLLPTLQEELQLFYQEQGFLDATIKLKLTKTKAIFIIAEKEPILIKAISIASDFPIQELIPFKKKERFVIPAFIRMKQKIKEKLLHYGYCSYEFSPKAYIYKAQHGAYISIYLQKGSICRIKSINVQGLKTLPKEVVLSHIYIHPQEPLSLQRLEESTKRLYSLEYFDQVRFDYSKKINNQIFLELKLKERQKRHLYKAGIGYESDRGFIANFSYKNLNYYAHQPRLSFYISDIKRSLTLADFYPSLYLLGDYFDVSVSARHSFESFDSFKERSNRVSLKLLQERYDLAYAVGVALATYDIFDAISCIPSKNYRFFTPFLELFYDKRDSKLFPTSGYYLKANLETEARYLKSLGELGAFFPLKYLTLFAKARVGSIVATHIPPSLLFFGGGIQTNRAYAYRSIYALDSDCKVGGKFLLSTTLELRKRLYDDIYGALFWDRTYLSRNLSLKHYVDGVGIGVLYPTPIGTIKLYFGLDPKEPSQNNLSLFIGASF